MPNNLKFKQIACGTAINTIGDILHVLYGLTEEGGVYQYNDDRHTTGWHKLPMNEFLLPNKPKND